MNTPINKELEELELLIAAEVLGLDAALKLRAKDALPHKLLKPHSEILKKLSSQYVEASAPLTISETEAKSYALYYLLINAQKFVTLFESSQILANYNHESLKIADIGAGPGSASLALLSTLNQPPELIHFIEKSSAMRDLCKALTSKHSRKPRSISFGESASVISSGTYDVVLIGNLLVETSAKSRSVILESAYRSLKTGGSLIVVEPALSEPTRLLMQERDFLLDRFDDLKVVFPCTHCSKCPMIKRQPKDWCHFPLSWNLPQLISQLDELSGFNKHRLKYSGFIFTKQELEPVRSTTYRVLVDAEKVAHGSEALICGERFFGVANITKREKSESNARYKKVRAGDLISISPGDELPSILKSDEVTILK